MSANAACLIFLSTSTPLANALFRIRAQRNPRVAISVRIQHQSRLGVSRFKINFKNPDEDSLRKHIQRECCNERYFYVKTISIFYSGLGHSAVQRLKNTWDRLPTKHSKAFEVSLGPTGAFSIDHRIHVHFIYDDL